MIWKENLCYNHSVPRNYEKKDAPIATRVPDAMKRQLDAIAEEHDRTVGYIIRELLGRGLAMYQADGQLRQSGIPAAEVRVGKVVAKIEPSDEIKERNRLRREFNKKTGS